MKRPATTVLALALIGLASGCKPSNPGVDTPPATSTNLASANEPLQSARDYAVNAATNTFAATTQAWAEVKASLQAATDYTYEHKDAFVAKINEEITVLDLQIKDLSDKTDDAAKTKLRALRAKRAVLDQKLDRVKNATAADWDDAKTDFQNACDDVETSFKDAWHSLTAS